MSTVCNFARSGVWVKNVVTETIFLYASLLCCSIFFFQADMLTIYVEFEAPRQKGWINSSRSKLGLIQNLFPSLLKALIFLNIVPKKFPILCCGIHQRLSYETFAFARPEKGKIELTHELCISVKLIIFKEYSSLSQHSVSIRNH